MNLLQQRVFFLWMVSLFVGHSPLFAQDKSPVKFGKITPADFFVSAGKLDSGAGALVIADIGRSEFVGNNRGSFTLQFHHFKRIKILNKSSFDAAKVVIPLYMQGERVEKLESLKAVTYNLENGKVVETKVDDKSVFTDKVSKNLTEKKFTFPSVKEGSIIEYTYSQLSDFMTNLQPWAFQGDYPCLWSEYEVEIPDFYNYVFLTQGYVPFAINTSNSATRAFNITSSNGAEASEHVSFTASVVGHRWVIKDVPALKEEAFTTTLRNHMAKIEFQLSQIRYPEEPIKNVMDNWTHVSEEWLNDDDFGGDLSKGNGWMDDDLKGVLKEATTPQQKAKKIFSWVRDNFTCTDHDADALDKTLKVVFKNRNGNVADINLLLTAMMRHENIQADPVLLSTRDHGYAHPIYPLMDRYNYVICRIKIDTMTFLLDASQPWLGFGRIPGYCYNGPARVINKENPESVNLDPDVLTEAKTTIVFISNDDKGGIVGSFSTTPGYIESSVVRGKVREKGEKEYFKNIQTAYSNILTISNPGIDSVLLPDYPVKVAYDFIIPHDTTEEIIYFSPVFATEAYKDNPFKATTRDYPVEIPYAMDETYVLNMEVPKGYSIEEAPKSAKVLFNTDEGFFEFLVQKDESNIQMRSRLKLLKANFKPEDYSVLRDFFAYVVKKQSEQFVFKKRK